MEKLEILKLPFPEPGPPITKMTGLSIVISDDRFGQKLELFFAFKASRSFWNFSADCFSRNKPHTGFCGRLVERSPVELLESVYSSTNSI